MEGKPSPRREVQLQGPRPTPLKVSKDSYKIRKPPPGPSQPAAPPPANQPARPPVIIYTVSPKVIHATASDFMTLVQRLTGASPNSSPSASSDFPPPDGQLSPAARLAALERAQTAGAGGSSTQSSLLGELGRDSANDMIMDEFDLPVAGVDWGAVGQGILSPMPGSLPSISPSFFSPAADPNTLSFLHDLSPIFHGNRNYIESTFLSSPTAFVSTPITSPTAAFDLFNQF